jgi:hypothetical protein
VHDTQRAKYIKRAIIDWNGKNKSGPRNNVLFFARNPRRRTTRPIKNNGLLSTKTGQTSPISRPLEEISSVRASCSDWAGESKPLLQPIHYPRIAFLDVASNHIFGRHSAIRINNV